MNTIGFLGTGRIADPMVRSLSRRFPDRAILVSERSSHISSELSKLDNVAIATNQQILDESDVVFLCLMANVAHAELPGLRFREGQAVISVMAEISLDEISDLISPAKEPCVTIPLPSIEQGGCPLPVYPKSDALNELFGEENMVIPQRDESAMNPHFAATAILSMTMMQLQTVAHWLGDKTGSENDGERYVASLVAGYLGAMPKDGNQRFSEAMEDLSTEGGLNNQLRARVTDSGFYDVLRQGLDELGERLG